MLDISVNTLDITQLERDDPNYQHEFAELYDASLQAVQDGRLTPLALPEGFGPGGLTPWAGRPLGGSWCGRRNSSPQLRPPLQVDPLPRAATGVTSSAS